MSFAENLAPFFADFGDAGTLAGRAVRGIYDDGAGTSEISGMLAQFQAPSYTLPAADVSSADDGAALVIATGRGAGSHTVRRIEPIDAGLVALLLKVGA
jgi:hypothetical protein